MSKQEQRELELNRGIKTKEHSRIVGLFDIDGTLTNGFAIFSFAEYLLSKNLFDAGSWELMQADFKKYQISNKDHGDYERFAINLVIHYARGLKGRSTIKIDTEAELFSEKVRKGEITDYVVLDFSPALVQMINNIGETIAISGSPYEVLLPIVRDLGFRELRATKMKISEGRFTGEPEINMALDTTKEQVVRESITGVDVSRSFAFGDSIHDLPILEAVENRFVLGDNSSLQDFAIKNGWGVYKNGVGVNDVVASRIKKLFE